jgi:hypothetical protein
MLSLITLANHLDHCGLYKEADRIDKMLKSAEVTRLTQNYIDDLKDSLKANKIGPEVLSLVFSVMDELALKGNYVSTTPSITPPDELTALTEGIAELERSMKDLTQELQTTTDERKKRELDAMLKKEQESYRSLTELLQQKRKD